MNSPHKILYWKNLLSSKTVESSAFLVLDFWRNWEIRLNKERLLKLVILKIYCMTVCIWTLKFCEHLFASHRLNIDEICCPTFLFRLVLVNIYIHVCVCVKRKTIRKIRFKCFATRMVSPEIKFYFAKKEKRLHTRRSHWSGHFLCTFLCTFTMIK